MSPDFGSVSQKRKNKAKKIGEGRDPVPLQSLEMTRRGYKVNMATIRRKERLKWRLLNPNVSCEKKMNHQNCILINLPALPPKHCLYFILKCLLHNVNLFWKHKNLGQSDDAKRRKRGWPNKWQSVIITQTLDSLGSSVSSWLRCGPVVLSLPTAR